MRNLLFLILNHKIVLYKILSSLLIDFIPSFKKLLLTKHHASGLINSSFEQIERRVSLFPLRVNRAHIPFKHVLF